MPKTEVVEWITKYIEEKGITQGLSPLHVSSKPRLPIEASI